MKSQTNSNLNWPSLLVLVRHGESEGNKYGGQHMAKTFKKPSYKYALTKLGRQQAKAAAKYIDKKFDTASFDVYLTSTYRRAQETFEIIFEKKKIKPIIDSRVNEITRGYASVVPKEELSNQHPLELSTFELNGWFHNVPLGGQSCFQLEHIIHNFLAFLREGYGGKRVVVVGHGTWINLCCRILMNRSIDEAERLHKEQFFKNAGVTVFEKGENGRFIMTEENTVPWEKKKLVNK